MDGGKVSEKIGNKIDRSGKAEGNLQNAYCYPRNIIISR